MAWLYGSFSNEDTQMASRYTKETILNLINHQGKQIKTMGYNLNLAILSVNSKDKRGPGAVA